ncbi:XTP/dITP diphosphohydrolase [Methanolinea mesophila]|uniref:RdgB/HAM1 family non-canonical purine NTP pyrophosphatase n=1 Tax=Methanolinea mesophila TaxID=547055 RepID=UPI001AE2DEC7|nr:XTP/dITP diphosphohydrolase [Methanolinea mesophila]
MNLTVVTSNPHKAEEVASFFGGTLTVTHVALECPEYRDDDVGKIAMQKAEFAWSALKTPLIVDDTAFSISALNDFPGPYAAYVLRTLGNRGILKLMEGEPDRDANFETAIAYADHRGIRVFKGRIEGRIVDPRGSCGFGYDPIFEWKGKTLAELPIEEKSSISHRARALGAFRDWFLSGDREREDR